jgi:hypothetical protein
MRGGLLIIAALAGAAHADEPAPEAEPAPERPIGSLGFTGDLTLSGPRPRQRFGVDATLYLNQRVGLYAAARQVTVEPLADAGHVTVGLAYRAAAARPRLELVLHGDAGAAWRDDGWVPAAGAGVTTFLWPLKNVPVALTTGSHGYVILDGVDDTHLAFSLGLGLAIAR